MSHELEMREDGTACIAYAGQTPWHGLGTVVGDDLTPNEIMIAAGIDWTVEKRDAYFIDDAGELVRASNKQVLVRSSDEKYLDVVSENWIPVQNEDALSFFDDYIKAGGMTMHTAGSLKDGKIIWALAKVDESFSLFGGKDEVESYLLLSNPHQFGRGVDIRFTPVRVVCHNTLSMSLESKATLGISLNHRQEFDAARVQEALAEAHQRMSQYQEAAEFLTTKRYKDNDVFDYFNRVFPKTNQAADLSFDEMMKQFQAGEKVLSRNADLAMEIMHDQPGADLGRGSFWQLYNTVTFMTNHVTGNSADTRLQSTWYGQNKNRNINALGVALEMAQDA